jgi:hypothetical protein
MYKDKVLQKEANRKANQRLREKQKGITPEGITEPGITEKVVVGEHGGYIPLRIVTDKSWVELIRYLYKELGSRDSFGGGKLGDDLRIGVNGVTVGDAYRMVECIG